MLAAETIAPAQQSAVPAPEPPRARKRAWEDAAVVLCYLLGTVYLLGPLLRNAGHGQLAVGGLDQTQEEWFLAHFAYALTHGLDPLFATVANTPLGINLMANASVMGLALPLTPVTVLFGPEVSFVVALGGGILGSAVAWYWLFSRHLPVGRVAAAIAGAFCGFAPAMISHANGGHLNFVSQALIPVIVWRVLKLREPGHAVRNGILLALPVCYQYFVAAEPLLLAALGTIVFVLAYAAQRPEAVRANWRPFLAGSGVAVGIGVLLLGYPIMWQFFGPQSFSGILSVAAMKLDVASWVSFPSQSIAGFRPLPSWLAPNETEENALFGWPLLILAAAATVRLWRESVVARAAAITVAIAFVTSLGDPIRFWGKNTGVPGPWRALAELPLFNSLLPSRMAIIAVPALGVLLALGIASLRAADRPWRWGLVAAALVPLVPAPLPVTNRPEVPEFFTHGHWRRYVDPGRAIVSAIPFDNVYGEPMRWQIAAGMGFRNAGGYFVGPVGKGRKGWYAPSDRQLTRLTREVLKRKEPILATGKLRESSLKDLQFWRADAIVLAAQNEPLRRTLDALLGSGTQIGGVYVWDVRHRQ